MTTVRGLSEHPERGSVGVFVMAALIEYVCIAKHEKRPDPSITVEQKSWAYCARGAGGTHEWSRIDATPLEILRSRPGNGRPYFVPDESDERSLTGGPSR